jgi:putative intracellular protease/amidase
LHPYEVFAAAGFDVDLASETGTLGFDFNSLQPLFLSGSSKAIYDNPDHPFMVKLNSQLRKASDLKKEEYGVFFASAGHAALYDYPTANGLQAIAADVWDRGGIVGTVCHGPAILPGIIDSKTGRSIVEGKTVTGFTIEGELIFTIDKLRQDKVVPVVEAVTAAGGYYSTSMNAFDDYSVTSGRLVTGTNPQSGRSAAERIARSYLGHPRIRSVRLKECRRDRRVPFYSRRWMFATINVTGPDPLFSTQWARGPNSAKASPGWNSCVVPSSW